MRALGFVLTCFLAACGGQLNVGKDDAMNEGGTTAASGSSGTGAVSGTAQAGFGGKMTAQGGTGGFVDEVTGGENNAFGGSMSVTGGMSGHDTAGGFSMGAYGGVMAAYGGKDTGKGGSAIAMGGATMTSGGTPPIPTWPTPDDVTEKPDLTGTWDGYTEDFLFRPLDRYRVQIAGVTKAGIIRGSVWFGEGMLAPPTDPDQAYPLDSNGMAGKGSAGIIFDLFPGATYTIVDGVQRDQVVRFQIMASELMRPWCELQMPFALETGGYNCLPAENYSWDQVTCTVRTPGGKEYSFGQAKCEQCLSCACDETGCTAHQQEQKAFDLKLSGDDLIGTVGDAPIRLKRAE